MTPEQICSTYRPWEIIVRRWMATWLDLLFLGGTIASLSAVASHQPAVVGSASLALLVLYYPVTEGLKGQTLGKLLCGLRVVDAKGGLPGIGKATVRTFLRLFEINPVLMGGMPAAWSVYGSPARQRLGDKSAGTYVLKTEDLTLLNPATAPGVPAIQEFSLPLGLGPAAPFNAQVAGPGFRSSGRLPTRNRIWPLPGALLTTAATAGLILAGIAASQAEKKVKPVTLTCAAFLASPPKEGWYRVTGCYYSINDLRYETEPVDEDDTNTPAAGEAKKTKIGNIYVPVFASRENGGKKTPLLVHVADEHTRKLLEQMLQIDNDGKQIDRWVEAHGEELLARREITGTVDEKPLLSDSLREELEGKQSRLSQPYRVLKAGGEPSGWVSVSAFAGALLLGLLSAIFWLLTLIALADTGGPRTPLPGYDVHR